MALSKGSRRFLVFLVVLFALFAGGFYWALQWWDAQHEGEPGQGEPVEFVVESGESASSISDDLEEAGVIKNAWVFRWEARRRGVDILAGRFTFETGMSVDEVFGVLEAGPEADPTFRVTVPEGLTVSQTLDRLGEHTPYSAEEYRQILDAERANPDEGPLELPDWVPPFSEFGEDIEVFEGLLFPQTYEFPEDAPAERVLQRMLDETTNVMNAVADETAVGPEGEATLSRYEILILASLVEREAQVADERPTIAAVMYNRIREGMPLQIDATVQYARGEHTERVLEEDTEIESPYNTYQVAGLPPTPISGAGQSAIDAAANPADAPYLYYVVAPACDGTHNFAETLDEHNANVREFRDSECAPS